ncbi:leucine-rich repeat flightless-interacting protein 2 isoform X17 [Ctenopharyngodon idella]|uniref:leucine-rich repeat flightless-interacting protein 2 isoform X17 n=1 Tax=Ctenopharyngodon idella TaxID=7959 RepID=UPI00222F4B7C|nr:leucine-rich repeat flightless-interacting protein 2 isoform X17 [Ctenopharyngodon idella]
MGSQGPGRKRTPSKNGLTAEEDALNVIAKEAEARLAAKRAARAEAREIRMRELERQQKEIYQVQKKYYGLDNLDNKWGDIEQWMEDSERYTRVSRRHASVSDDEERMSVGSRSNIRLDLDAAGAYGGLPQAAASHSHKKSKKKKKHSSKPSNGYDDDLSTLSSRSSRLSDESKMTRSSRLDLQSSAYYSSELYSSSSSYSSKHQVPSYSGYQLPLLHSRKHRGSIYEDSLYSGSRRSSARASSEYSGFLGSSSRTSSRANSACGSPVEDCSSSVASFMRSTANISGLSRDLDRIIIPDLPNVNGRLSMVDDKLERDYVEKGSSRASTISGATLTSLGGTSSRRGSGDTSISADTEASIREIKDSLLEVEEKYRKAMVSNAQLDNEKTNMMYEVDTLKDSLMELEEMLFETRRELEEKCKDLEREKHAHSILQFQFSELKETLKQSEELLTKHGIVLGPDLATNGETGEEVGKAEQNSQTASAEIREGSSILGTHQLKLCKDQQQKDLDDRMQGNQQSSHAPFSSTKTPLEANKNGDLGDQMNQGVGQLENRPEEPPSSVGEELTAARPKEQIKSEAHIKEDSRSDTEELECKVHKDGLMETNQQESECVKPSKEIKEETPLESVSGSIHDETDKPGEAVLDDELKEESVESSQMETLPKTQGASASNKKKKKKKKNKQKQKQNDKQESETKMDDKNEVVLSEDNLNQEMEGLEENHEKPLGNDVSKTTMNADVPRDDKGTNELDCVEITSTNINADDAQDKIQLVTDEADSAEISKTISNSDCPESSNDVLLDDLSNDVISNPANIIDDHTEDSTNTDPEPVILSSELMASETETSLPHEPSAQPMDTVGVCVESISSSENIENSSLVGVKEEKSHLDCEVEEQKERLQNIDLDGDTIFEDQDKPDKISSPVMENVENDAENVIQEQPIDQPMESQLPDSIGADVDQEEVETQDEELDEENLNVPSEKVFDGGHVEDIPLIETQIQVIHEDHVSSNEANQETVVDLEASDQEPKVEKVQEERSIQDHDGCHVEDIPLIETLIQVIHEDHLSSNEANQETVVDLEASDQEPKVEKVQEERSIQDHDGCHVEDTPLIETQIQVIHEDHLSSNEANQETVVDLEASEQEPKVEKVQEERSIQDHDGCHVEDTPLIETQIQVIHEDHLSSNEANQETVVDLEASEQEPKVENAQEEKSVQDQVTINVQLPEDDEDLLVKSDVVLQELKEKDEEEEEEEEEDEGESFDFDEMDLEASSGAPLRNLLDQPNEDSALLKENAQEASQEMPKECQ